MCRVGRRLDRAPAAGNRRQAAEALPAAPQVFAGTSTAAIASAIRHAHLHHPAGLLNWRITH